MGERGRNSHIGAAGSRRKKGGRRAQQPAGRRAQPSPGAHPGEGSTEGRGEGRAASRRAPRGRRGQRRPRSKVKTLLIFVLLPLLVLGGAGFAWMYFALDGNLKTVDIEAELGSDRPPEVDNGSMDVLVLGSDSRQGDNGQYGKDVGSARSDIAMIVHVHAGNEKASVVSIPRDTLVSRPQCMGRSKVRPAAERQMFNTAYEIGGPACAVKTAEKLSGLRMDHYVEVDFGSFKTLIDALGGVPITTTKAIDDPKSHLKLAAGTHRLDGEQALGLVRTRKSVGDSSDLGRIQLQQAFMKALMEEIKGVGVLNPKKLYGLADAATQTLTTDSGLGSVMSLASFGNRLGGIGSKDMNMITLPIDYDAKDPERVIPLKDQSELLWMSLRMDKPIPPAVTENSAGDKVDAGKVVKSD
ncbi:LCP family protein [Streptomyces candidus]|uniref:LCP family protein required for cell wall assembly n=1 Tax=Streptomyces candidus TaxID=67283 RepID=A0A7X0LTS6_9ACTN|nr:LCP family protein [Streptomyces candidus]MBB6439351.1 LCP family protein required for cell wall assembly [Streptomyces candidus]GHH42256.1 transcriptional regulator [Streptomyces candidus]